MHSGFIAGHYAMNECVSFLFVVCQQCFRNLNTSSFLLITQQPGYPLGQNFSKHQLIFDDGLHGPIADTRTCTKLLTNFNHSKPTIAFNKVTNRCDILWGDACPWASLMTCVCTVSLPPRNSLCQNFTCVFDSVDSPYFVRNLCQISLGSTFSLVRNFITTRCAIVIGTPLSRSS